MTEPASPPKCFLSYCWTSQQLVLQLAKSLRQDGVEVILDLWHLTLGHDTNTFMEQMVNDPDIKHVAIICDREYVRRANQRIGGVGIESRIIAAQLYGKEKQRKFVAVVVERADDGTLAVPTFCNGRLHIDMSDDTRFQAHYPQLIRWIFDRPAHQPPPLGPRPQHLLGATGREATISASRGRRRRHLDDRPDPLVKRLRVSESECAIIKRVVRTSLKTERAFDEFTDDDWHRLTSLSLSREAISREGIAWLIETHSPRLSELRQLRLGGTHLGDESVRLLCASPLAIQLELLDLDDSGIGDDSLAQIAECCPKLRSLYAAQNPGITNRGVIALGATGTALRGLEELYVSRTATDHNGLADLIRLHSPLEHLRLLDFRRTGVTDELGRAMRHASARLRILYVGGNPLTDEGIRLLTNTDSLKHLEVLGIRGTAMSDAGVLYVARSRLQALRELYLGDNLLITDVCIQAFADKDSALGRLTLLSLDDTSITDSFLHQVMMSREVLSELKTLEVRGTCVTVRGAGELRKTRTMLKVDTDQHSANRVPATGGGAPPTMTRDLSSLAEILETEETMRREIATMIIGDGEAEMAHIIARVGTELRQVECDEGEMREMPTWYEIVRRNIWQWMLKGAKSPYLANALAKTYIRLEIAALMADPLPRVNSIDAEMPDEAPEATRFAGFDVLDQSFYLDYRVSHELRSRQRVTLRRVDPGARLVIGYLSWPSDTLPKLGVRAACVAGGRSAAINAESLVCYQPLGRPRQLRVAVSVPPAVIPGDMEFDVVMDLTLYSDKIDHIPQGFPAWNYSGRSAMFVACLPRGARLRRVKCSIDEAARLEYGDETTRLNEAGFENEAYSRSQRSERIVVLDTGQCVGWMPSIERDRRYRWLLAW